MTEQTTTHRCRFCGEPRPYANSPCTACATFGAAPEHPLDTPTKGAATMISQADANAYLDTMVTGGMGAAEMEQEIRARMAHMVPWLQTAWEDSLTKQPPRSMMTWALLVLSSRNDRAAYPHLGGNPRGWDVIDTSTD